MYAFPWKSNDIVVIALDMVDVFGKGALNRVAACFVVGFFCGEIGAKFFIGIVFEIDARDLCKHAGVLSACLYQSDAGCHIVHAAAQLGKHTKTVCGIAWLAHDLVRIDDGIGGKDDGCGRL